MSLAAVTIDACCVAVAGAHAKRDVAQTKYHGRSINNVIITNKELQHIAVSDLDEEFELCHKVSMITGTTNTNSALTLVGIQNILSSFCDTQCA